MTSDQATWPIQVLADAADGDLHGLFDKLPPSAFESMHKWYFDELDKDLLPFVLKDEELKTAFGDALPKLQLDLDLSEDDAVDVLRQFILRTFAFLSRDGRLPSRARLDSTAALIKSRNLPRLFPAFEQPAEVRSIEYALER